MMDIRAALEARYGSRRAMVRNAYYLATYRLGMLARYQQIDWRSVNRLVFVCKGNICRSPYAEVVAATRGVQAISCGLEATAGSAATREAIRNAGARGVDLRGHRAQRLQDIELAEGDLLVAMDPEQARRLDRQLGDREMRAQITLLGIWSEWLRPFLADPFGRTDSYFQTCYSCIDTNLEHLIRRLREAK